MTPAPLLQLRRIEKRFPGVYALRGVSLEVHAGEVVALLGENGAGKSTLMKIVGGIEPPDAGELLIDGAPVAIRGVAAATALGIAFIHQELNLLDNLDVAGNVLLGREPTRWGALRFVDRAKMHQTVQPYLDQLGLGLSPGTPTAALSIAQQQLIEIAKALSLDARLIIMDEPTSSLTLTEAGRLHEVVASLRERGVAVIYITHRLGEVRTVADRAVVLRDGANAGALGREALTHDNMIGLMIGRNLDAAPASVRVGEDGGYFRVDGLRTRRYPQHAISFAVARGEILGVAGLRVTPGERPGHVRVDDPRWHGYLANVGVDVFLALEREIPEELDGEAFLARYGGTTDLVTRVDPARRYAVRTPTAHPIYEHERVTEWAGHLRSTADVRRLGALMYESHASYSACGLGSTGTDRLVAL
ncbi:MAG: sugar ABC transporter ATP-binding protein, partial [Vicinamibacterales bacterium]